jgi:hypothetical protein
MPDHNPLIHTPSKRPHGCIVAAFWVAVAAGLSLGCAALAAWLLTARISEETRALAREVAGRFETTFNFRPEVRVDGVVVVEGYSPILQIVTAETKVLARHRWSHTYLYSTKTLEIEAPFTAKAGFDMENPIRLRIEGNSRVVGADLPPPSVLSFEMGELNILRDEDGLWNKLTAEDRESAIRELRAKARADLEASAFLARARNETEERVRALLRQPPGPP